VRSVEFPPSDNTCKYLRKHSVMCLFLKQKCNRFHVLKKRRPVHAVKAYRGMEAYLHTFVTSELVEGSGHLHVPIALHRQKDCATSRIGGWKGPGSVWKFWRKEKSLALSGTEPRSVGRPSCSTVNVPTTLY
jgi:hypothetical protein